MDKLHDLGPFLFHSRLPLTFREVFVGLKTNDDWYYFWLADSNFYRVAGYNLILFTFGTYMPMMMQMASLIFGFVRNK